MNANNIISFHFAQALWGRKYTDFFLNFALPNQLSSGNLPQFAGFKESVYKIYTTSSFKKEIEEHNSVKILKKYLRAEVIDFLGDEEVLNGDKYSLMTKCHQNAVYEAKKQDAYLILLCPDIIFGDGFADVLIKSAKNGKKALMVSSIVGNKKNISEILANKYYSSEDNTIFIKNRDLLKIAFENMHKVYRNFFWNSKPFTNWPSFVLWQAGEEGFVARWFHMHPLMVKVSGSVEIDVTLDMALVQKMYRSMDDIHVVTNSDEIIVIEMSDERNENIVEKASVKYMYEWSKKYTDEFHHRLFVNYPVFYHMSDNKHLLEAQLKESEVVVSEFKCLTEGVKLLEKYYLFLDEKSPYYSFVSLWNKKKREGCDIIKYLRDNNLFPAGIYGLGTIGEFLIEELKCDSSLVKFIIDKRVEMQGGKYVDIPVVSEDFFMFFEKVNSIIVTPVFDFDAIKNKLSKLNPALNLISLEEIVKNF